MRGSASATSAPLMASSRCSVPSASAARRAQAKLVVGPRVVLRVADGEGARARVAAARARRIEDRGDDGRVEAAREEGAERHVAHAPEPRPPRRGARRAGPAPRPRSAAPASRVADGGRHQRAGRDAAVLPDERAAGLELAHAAKHRRRRRHVAQRQVGAERVLVEAPIDGSGSTRSDLSSLAKSRSPDGRCA